VSTAHPFEDVEIIIFARHIAPPQFEIPEKPTFCVVISSVAVRGSPAASTSTRMRTKIRVDPIRERNQDADSFYVRFSYPEANVARTVTERLGGLFIDVNARDRGNLAQATNSFLETQLDDARKNLETQENRLKEFQLVDEF
jgi:hypothetical protein